MIGDRSQATLSVAKEGSDLIVRGINLDDSAPGQWQARVVDSRRVLVSNDESRPQAQPSGSLASLEIAMFKDFLIGLHRSQWTGVLVVDTDHGIKKIFVSHGEIVFAASNIIDDRLGEIIFREAKISLDELTNSAAQVTKSQKFGQVVISNGIFSNLQLWDALKLQVKQILRSVFMVDRVFIEIDKGPIKAPTEVVFVESFEELINESFSYGLALREFVGKLGEDSQVELINNRDRISVNLDPGTFVGDLVQLIETKPLVQDLLEACKLIDLYTVDALFRLVNLGICRIHPDVDESRKYGQELAPLKSKIDAYAYVLDKVRRAFVEADKPFPIDEMQDFAQSLNPEGFPSILLDDKGNLSRECNIGLYSQCTANTDRVGYFLLRIESLIQFLLHVAGDNLDFKIAGQIRQDFRLVTA